MDEAPRPNGQLSMSEIHQLIGQQALLIQSANLRMQELEKLVAAQPTGELPHVMPNLPVPQELDHVSHE